MRKRGEDGTSLVELLVTMFLLAIVSALVSTAVITANKILHVTDAEASGAADVRTASERLVRDIRDARSVVCNPAGTDAALASSDPTCRYHLQLWVDYNSDYKQQNNETITWQLIPSIPAGQFSMVRSSSAGASKTEAVTVVRQVAFSYDVLPGATAPAAGVTGTQLVSVNMVYNASVANAAGTRTVSFTARPRNVSQ
jgi:Tfp pilus assembly protein PilW